MAEQNEKQTFLMYCDWETLFSSLEDNAEAGKLIKSIFAYVKRGEMPDFNGALKTGFLFMAQQITKDGGKWDEVREKRREAAQKRWNSLKNANDTNAYNSMQMHANAYTCMQNMQKHASKGVNVNDNVNVNVNVNDINTLTSINNNNLIKEKNIKKEKSKSKALEMIESYTDNKELQQALDEFVKMRRTIKAPLTERALTLCFNNLDKLGSNDEMKTAIVNQSIANSWKGLFPLKQERKEEKPDTDVEEYKAVINKFLY